MTIIFIACLIALYLDLFDEWHPIGEPFWQRELKIHNYTEEDYMEDDCHPTLEELYYDWIE